MLQNVLIFLIKIRYISRNINFHNKSPIYDNGILEINIQVIYPPILRIQLRMELSILRRYSSRSVPPRLCINLLALNLLATFTTRSLGTQNKTVGAAARVAAVPP